MSKFQEMKIRVKNPEESAAIQDALFKQGYTWLSGSTDIKFTDSPFISVKKGGYLVNGIHTNSGFYNSTLPEVKVNITTSVEFIVPPPETVELNGKTYLKSDLELALDKLTPV
jgi:hypothetical protein